MTSYFFPILLEPARVTHQSGTRITRGHAYKSAALREWEATLEKALKPYVLTSPLEGPVALNVSWYFKTANKKKFGSWKVTKPDTDNMQKTLKDIMTKTGFWKDDAQVVVERVEKVWSDVPGIFIHIEELEEKKYDPKESEESPC